MGSTLDPQFASAVALIAIVIKNIAVLKFFVPTTNTMHKAGMHRESICVVVQVLLSSLYIR